MNRFVPILFLLLFSTLAEAAGVPVIGLDDSGDEVTYVENEDLYVGRMSAIATSVGDSVVATLENEPSKWMLRTVAIGIGGGVQVGIGPIIQVKASPRFRLVYSNSKDPVVP